MLQTYWLTYVDEIKPLGIKFWYRTTRNVLVLDGIEPIRSVSKMYRTRYPVLVQRPHMEIPEVWTQVPDGAPSQRKQSFLRRIRQGGVVERSMSSGNQVRVGQYRSVVCPDQHILAQQ